MWPLRHRAVESGGESETSIVARNDAEGFWRDSRVGGTPALSVAGRSKQRHRRGARPAGGRRWEILGHSQRQDHADRHAETRIKTSDARRQASYRHQS